MLRTMIGNVVGGVCRFAKAVKAKASTAFMLGAVAAVGMLSAPNVAQAQWEPVPVETIRMPVDTSDMADELLTGYGSILGWVIPVLLGVSLILFAVAFFSRRKIR